MNFIDFLGDIADQSDKLQDNDAIEIYKDYDSNTEQDLIVISMNTKEQESKFFVDPDSKLLVKIERTRCDNMGDSLKNADEFNYDVPIPDELLNFEIPQDVKIINESENLDLLNDPNFGIPADGIAMDEAFIKIVKEYAQAAIDSDWDKVRNLCPLFAHLSDEDLIAKHGGETPVVALLEVGQPYSQRGLGIGKITPCVVKLSDGKIKEVRIITTLRRTNNYSYCIIYGSYGESRDIE